MKFLELEILCLIGISFAVTTAQFPVECSCPNSCICNLQDKTIDCVNQRLKHVPVELNSCSWPGITKVDLSNNRIRFVHEFAFSLLGNITHLDLYDNLINEVDRSAFIGLQSLEYLYLDGNRLSSLPYTVFWPLRHLKKLLLYGNLLTDLPFRIFQSQHLLTQLALHDNRLSRLHTEIFDNLPLLQELYLHENQISDLSGAPFRSLRQLNTLYLNDNRLTQLTRFDFLGLNRVSKLLLSNNQISIVEDETFRPTLKLQFLYLENNRLSTINLLVFSGPVELLQLRVFNNQIERISGGAFFRLRKLQKLSLYNNQLTELTKQTFVGLDSLTELILYGNNIRLLANDTFLQSPLLEQLWLYDNELSCIEETAFKGLDALQILQLGQNRLSYLPENVFTYTPSLIYLLLYANNFRTINNRPFKNLHNLVQLSLASNSIEFITEGALDGSNQIFYFQWSTVVSPNSLHCDCSALWLYHWMVSRTLQSSVTCAGPSEFKGQDIRSLRPASFGCSANNLRLSTTSGCSEHVVSRNGCLRLICSSSPRGLLQWSRVDGKPLRPVSESCSSVSPCVEGIRGEGVLVVETMREEDAGHYICTASFQNQTLAQVCHVTVGDPPVLLEEPDEMVLPHPGVLARFYLRMSGTPWPEVSWSHISLTREVVPLAETGADSRYLVSKNGTLLIPETRLDDEGTYRAILRNGAGELVVEVPLSFLFETSCHSNCLHNGTCVDISVCMCDANYEGSSCQILVEPDNTQPGTESTPSLYSPLTTPELATTLSDSSPTPEFDSTLPDDYVGSGSLLVSTQPFSGYGPDNEASRTTTERATDGSTADLAMTTTPVSDTGSKDCSGVGSGSGSSSGSSSGSGCEPSTTRMDTEGLMDDEDYIVTTSPGPAHDNARSTTLGSGNSEYTMYPGTVTTDHSASGSGMRQDNNKHQQSRRKRNTRRMVGVVPEVHHRARGITHKPTPKDWPNFQAAVREVVERKKSFEAKLEDARVVAKARKRFSKRSFITTPTVPEQVLSRDRVITGGGGAVTHDNGLVDENPDMIHLYKELVHRNPTGEDMHTI